MQLREKQKAKRYYGVLEKQFKNYYDIADNQEGIAGENLLRLLERRFDNVVYRMGLASSHKEARQLVLHGHFTLNGKNANIPSILVKPGDVIAVKDTDSVKIKELIENMQVSRNIPKQKKLFQRLNDHIVRHGWFYGAVVQLLGTAALTMLGA